MSINVSSNWLALNTPRPQELGAEVNVARIAYWHNCWQRCRDLGRI